MNSIDKHTPGPWRTYRPSEPREGWLIERSGRCIAETFTMDTPSEEEANAVLIAAAPDLLAALEPFANLAVYSDAIQEMAMTFRPVERAGLLAAFDTARKVSAKAKGVQS